MALDCIDHGRQVSAGQRGYAKTAIRGAAGKQRKVWIHRLVYAQAHNITVDDITGVIMHTCDNPRCINPLHLRLGTQLDNIADMMSKGRQARGTMKPNAKLNEQLAMTVYYATGKHIDIAKQFGISKASVGDIKSRRTWKHIHG